MKIIDDLPSSMYLFGINLTNYSRLTQFLLTSTAVLFFHVTQGYIQVFRNIIINIFKEILFNRN
jgi:hypothetical protein